MKEYRMNLRFNLEDDMERQAAEYLQQFPRRGKLSQNRFVINVLCTHIAREAMDDTKLLNSIRDIFREEIQAVSFSPVTPIVTKRPLELTEEEKAANTAQVLQDLEDFFG